MSFGNNNDDNPWGSPPPQRPRRPQQPQKPTGSEQPDIDEMVRRMQEKMKNIFGGGGNNGGNFQNNNGLSPRGIALIGVGIFLLWLSSGIYKVNEGERGVVLRLGEYHREVSSGLNYHLPAPIESVFKPGTRVNRFSLGSGDTSMSSNRDGLMLTGDENIIDINFEVQWVVKGAKDFLFNVRDPSATLKQASESAMREIIGKTPIAFTQAEGRLETETQVRDLLQKTMDFYGAGIEIQRVQLLKVDPPKEVIDAFLDVQAARTDQERLRNEAEVYKNDIVPKARGEAEKMIQDAMAYKQKVVANAEGEAARFESVYNEYQKAPDVMRKRIYLETMESVLSGTNKIIADTKGGNGVVPFLSLNELTKKPSQDTQQ